MYVPYTWYYAIVPVLPSQFTTKFQDPDSNTNDQRTQAKPNQAMDGPMPWHTKCIGKSTLLSYKSKGKREERRKYYIIKEKVQYSTVQYINIYTPFQFPYKGKVEEEKGTSVDSRAPKSTESGIYTQYTQHTTYKI